MQKPLLRFFLLITLSSYGQKPQPFNQDSVRVFEELKANPYPYATELSGGYYLKHRVFKQPDDGGYVQSLSLMKGDSLIREFSYFGFGLVYKNIGYISVDFGESFVMAYSYGAGNPHRIELIDKATGKELKTGTWVDADKAEKVLLYIVDEHEPTQQLKLLDLKHDQESDIDDLNTTSCTRRSLGGLRSCVRFDTVNQEQIVLVSNDDPSLKRIVIRKL